MVPTHNCARYLGPCLESVLVQAPGPDEMEIVVVDDRSDDDPEAVVRSVAGPRVDIEVNPHNRGAIGNFNACLARARGQLVHLLHGDDLVRPGFYARADQAFAAHDDVGAFVSRVTYVDEAGHPLERTRPELQEAGRWPDALEVLSVSNRIRPPGVAARRRLYETVGGFRTDLPHAADWEMWVRLAAAAPVWYDPEVLAAYRRHRESDTAARVLSGANLTERARAIDLVSHHLAPARRRRQRRRAHGYSALFATRTAAQLLLAGELRGAANQAAGAARALGRAVTT